MDIKTGEYSAQEILATIITNRTINKQEFELLSICNNALTKEGNHEKIVAYSAMLDQAVAIFSSDQTSVPYLALKKLKQDFSEKNSQILTSKENTQPSYVLHN